MCRGCKLESVVCICLLQGRVTGQELLTRTLEESRASGDSEYFGLASYEGTFVVGTTSIPNIYIQLSLTSAVCVLLRSAEMDNCQQTTQKTTERYV